MWTNELCQYRADCRAAASPVLLTLLCLVCCDFAMDACFLQAAAPRRQVVRMGNKATGGPFSPLVVVVRNVMGDKEFNKLRGKAISFHSQSAYQ
jgi:hypothetical protein